MLNLNSHFLDFALLLVKIGNSLFNAFSFLLPSNSMSIALISGGTAITNTLDFLFSLPCVLSYEKNYILYRFIHHVCIFGRIRLLMNQCVYYSH